MKLGNWILTCALAGSAAAQVPTIALNAPIEDLGTLDLMSGVITPPAPIGAQPLIAGVVYDNTCIPYAVAACNGGIVFINQIGIGQTWMDAGRMPSVTSPAPNVGTMNAYRVTTFQIGYATNELDTSLGGPGALLSVLFWEDGDVCQNTSTLPAPNATFNLALPGTLTAGTVRALLVNVNIAGAEFTMKADGNGTYDASPALDTFAYGYQVTTGTAGAATYIIRAGQIATPNPCGMGDGTYFLNPGTMRGTGLDNTDLFSLQTTATAATCYIGNASQTACTALPGPIYAGVYMEITADISDCNTNLLPDADDITSGFSLDLNVDGIPDECQVVPFTPYCTAGTSANQCVASISGTGSTSIGTASGLIVNVNGVEGQKQGIIFYGITTAIGNPWALGSTSFLCVKAPSQRTGVQNSGGTLNGCDGTMTLDVFSYLAAHPTALGNPFSAGQNAFFQGWYRDPPSPKTTSLTDGLQVTFVP